MGGDALNRVPDRCVIDVDVRHLPEQDPDAIVAAVGKLPGVEVVQVFRRPPVMVSREDPFVRTLAEAISHVMPDVDRISIGRHGASDVTCFLDRGIPAVEFGPVGDGHHGPEEWVSISSLERYRRALVGFAKLVPQRIGGSDGRHLEAV